MNDVIVIANKDISLQSILLSCSNFWDLKMIYFLKLLDYNVELHNTLIGRSYNLCI